MHNINNNLFLLYTFSKQCTLALLVYIQHYSVIKIYKTYIIGFKKQNLELVHLPCETQKAYKSKKTKNSCVGYQLFNYYLVLFGLYCLRSLSTIFQLYRGGQFYWWRKPQYQRPVMTTTAPNYYLKYKCLYINQYCLGQISLLY